MSSTRYYRLSSVDEKHSISLPETRITLYSKEKAAENELKACIEMLENAIKLPAKRIWQLRAFFMTGLSIVLCVCIYQFLKNNALLHEKHQAENIEPQLLNEFTSAGYTTHIGNGYWSYDLWSNCDWYFYDYTREILHHGKKLRTYIEDENKCPAEFCNEHYDYNIIRAEFRENCCPIIFKTCENLSKINSNPLKNVIGYSIGLALSGAIILGEIINIILSNILKLISSPRLLFKEWKKNYLSPHQVAYTRALAAMHDITFLENDLNQTLENFKTHYRKITASLAFLSAEYDEKSNLHIVFNHPQLRAKPLARPILQLAGLIPTTEEKENKRKQKRIAFLAGSVHKNANSHAFFSAIKQNDPIYKNSDDMLNEIFSLAGMERKPTISAVA